MSNKKESIRKRAKREVTRLMLEYQQVSDMNQMMDMFGAAEEVSYDNVEENLNVAYVNREETALAMDIFKPKVKEGTELPVIVVVHGGGLFMGDRGINRPYCRMLAHRGYLVFSLEYRLAPRANIGQQFDDVCSGMDRVGEMLIDYDVDFSRIFLVADSAGAYLGTYVSAMHDSVKLQNAIERKPSRMVFAAVGFICGMFYPNKMLEDQIFGERRGDEKFLRFMNVEHPEIVSNLPAAFLITSCGDIYNNFSIRYHEALKKAGRWSKLVYFGDEDLMHIFPIMNPEHPRSQEATDKMLEYFEEQAIRRHENRMKDPAVEERRKQMEARIADGSMSEQKLWRNIKERLHVDERVLDRAAIIDCTRQYTYREMLDEWERYARAFSGLGIGYKNKSRVALCGAITAEPVFALFGLNMTGAEVSLYSYPDFLPGGMWRDMLEKEHITDLIVQDTMVTPEIWKEIEEAKEELGLEHVILLHSLMGGPAIGPAELTYNEFNYHMLKRRSDTVFMEDLLEEYKDHKIAYDRSKGSRTAVITHTSGTTKGTRKLLPFTDKVLNEQLKIRATGGKDMHGDAYDGSPMRVISLFDMSSIMGLAAQVLGPLAYGDSVVMTFFGFMHPKFIRAVDYYNVNFMIITGFMADKWLERDDIDDIDFSSLKVLGMSGGYISPEKMEEYTKFFKAHGFKYEIMNGYGMSESGGQHMVMHSSGDKKDILGYADSMEDIRIKDEKDGKYYKASDGPRTGVLYTYSDTRPSNELDGQVFFELTEIDGRDFLCTNDLVRVNEDGSIAFAGRADKYFVNNEGKKFDSGIVDMNMAKCKAIDRCAVVPVMEKRIHDTVPVLYVVPTVKGADVAEEIRKAFVEVYVKEKAVPADNLPVQFMIVDDIPINANGKLDIFRITRERLEGDAYNISAVMDGDEITDISMEHVAGNNSFKAGALPHGMENHSAYNSFDFFTTPSSKKREDEISFMDIMMPWKLFMPKKEKKKKFDMNAIIEAVPDDVKKTVIKHGNRIAAIPNGRKWIDVDFEDEC